MDCRSSCCHLTDWVAVATGGASCQGRRFGASFCLPSRAASHPRGISDADHGRSRRFFVAVGGTVEGPRLTAEVLPDGGDWLLIRPDGIFEQDVRITLRADDDTLIYVRYEGVRQASPEVAARLAAGEPVERDEYYFPIIGVGERVPGGVRYDVFAVL